jgi:DNA-binding CsgD family transcriptional regulator
MSDDLNTGNASIAGSDTALAPQRLSGRQPPRAIPLGNAQVRVDSSPFSDAWKAAVDLTGGDTCIGILNVPVPNAKGTIFSSGCSQSELTFINAENLSDWLEAEIGNPEHNGAPIVTVDPKVVAEVANIPWLKTLSALAVNRTDVSNEGVVWLLIGWRRKTEDAIDRRRLSFALRVLANCAITYNANIRRERRLQILEGMVDELAPALILVSPTAQVFWTNYRAELLLAERKLLIRNGGNMLASRTSTNTVILRQAIQEVILTSRQGDDDADRFLLMPKENGNDDVVVLRPVAGRHGLEGNRAVLVIVPQDDVLLLAGKLVGLFGLIPSEARFVSAIIQAGSSAHAAAHLGITEQTAKTYMKRIYAKLGISSQLELGMLLASLAPPLRSGQAAPDSRSHHLNAF